MLRMWFCNFPSPIPANAVCRTSAIAGRGGDENRRICTAPGEIPSWAVQSGNATCGRMRIRANNANSQIRIAHRQRFIDRLSLPGIRVSIRRVFGAVPYGTLMGHAELRRLKSILSGPYEKMSVTAVTQQRDGYTHGFSAMARRKEEPVQKAFGKTRNSVR